MQQKQMGLFEFEGFRLDAAERRLTKAGENISLPPKVFDLLHLLVEHHGRLLEKNVLLTSLWPDSFVEESNLSVNVSALRRALGEAATGGKFIETVPKRGYRFIAPVTEIVPQERAPETPPEPAPESAPPPKRTASLAWVVAACALALCAGSLLWVFGANQVSQPQLRAVAVLPFNPISGDDSQQYLGLGMADAIATRLSELKKVEVRPISSVVRFSGVQRDVLAAGKELQVDAVVEGHLQQVDKRIRVTAQVWRISDSKQLWAETFDDDFTNIFELQDAIAQKVAQSLALNVTQSEKAAASARQRTTNTEAYRLFLQGTYLAAKRLNPATQSAIEYFQKSIAADPGYALPYTALANSYLFRFGEGLDPSLREPAKVAALKALSLDEKLPESHLALGQVLLRTEWDWAGAERGFRRAIALNPQLAPAHAALSTVHVALGRPREGVREMETAVQLEPSSVSLRSDLAWALLFAHRYKEAVLEATKAIEIDPWSYTAHRQF
ncbi:MAG: winged helix-turn-helix domain-containing protein, partial [Bryobacteraceae bacterium]